MCSWNGHRRGWWFLLGFPFFLVFLAVASLVVMLLWNWLLPTVLGLKAISYLQAAGLLILAKILFGGIGRRSRYYYGGPRRWKHWRKWHEEDSETTSSENPKQ